VVPYKRNYFELPNTILKLISKRSKHFLKNKRRSHFTIKQLWLQSICNKTEQILRVLCSESTVIHNTAVSNKKMNANCRCLFQNMLNNHIVC